MKKATHKTGGYPGKIVGNRGDAPGTSRPDMGESGTARQPVLHSSSGMTEDPRRGVDSDVRRGSAAFTLIEVLLALALFAIAVVVLAASYINVLFGLEAVRADRVLEQEMSFVRSVILTAPDLDTIEEGGELPTGAMGYAYWEAELEPTQIADLFVVRVSVVLQGTGDDEERSLTERLVVLRPAWSEPVDREELRAESMQRLEEVRRNRPL